MGKGFKIALCAFSTAAAAAVEYVVLDNSLQPPDVVETSPGVEFIAKGADGVLLDAAEDFSIEILAENSLEGVSYDIYSDDGSLKLSGTGNMVPVSLADGAGNVYLRSVFAAGAPGNVITGDGGFIELGGGTVPDVPEFKGAWAEQFTTNGAGRIYLEPGDYTFAIGADDEASFTMGDVTSEIYGSHALEWGDPASFSVLQAGVYEYSWDYRNLGGPYELRFSSNISGYSATSIPYARLVLSTDTIYLSGASPQSVSWEVEGMQSGVEYSVSCSSPLLGGNGASGSARADRQAALESNQSRVEATITLTETYKGFSHTSSGKVAIVCSGTCGSGGGSGGSDSGSGGESGSGEGGGEGGGESGGGESGGGESGGGEGGGVGGGEGNPYGPLLRVDFNPDPLFFTNASMPSSYGQASNIDQYEYSITGVDSDCLAYDSANPTNLCVTPSSTALALLDNPVTTYQTNLALVAWRAVSKNNQNEIYTGTSTIEVIVEISGKDKTPPVKCGSCGNGNGCAEGTETGDECVYFAQTFGRTVDVEGMPVGKLAIEEETFSPALFTPLPLRYRHPMMRKLDVARLAVACENGRVIAYQTNGMPVAACATVKSRLVANGDGSFDEIFEDRSRVCYSQSGEVCALVSTLGVKVPVDELGISVLHDEYGVLTNICSTADGTLEIETTSGTSYEIRRKDPSGNLVKTWTFSQAGETTLRLMDNCYPVSWTWVAEDGDFTMVRGEGLDASVTRRRTEYQGRYTDIVLSRFKYSDTNRFAAIESRRLDAMMGNATVSVSRGSKNLYSMVRVPNGNGAGLAAVSTNELALVTSYSYDEWGRTLSRTQTGSRTNRIEYVYSNDPFDFRPVETRRYSNGILVRTDTFSEIADEDGRTEIFDCGGRTSEKRYFPADAEDRFCAGRLALEIRQDDRATEYAYDGTARTVTATEGIAPDGAFVLIDGKSTRTIDTYDTSGNLVRIERFALVDGAWHELDWEERTYSAAHRHIGTVRSDGRWMDSRWNCTGPLWEISEDGVAVTNTYNSLKELVSSLRYGPHGTLETQYGYDADGRKILTRRGSLVSSVQYDEAGRIVSQTGEDGLVTSHVYFDDPRLEKTVFPSGATRIVERCAEGDVHSITGTSGVSEYYTRGTSAEGLEWTQVNYRTPSGARWRREYANAFGEIVRIERPGANGNTNIVENIYDSKGRLVEKHATGMPDEIYTYDSWGDLRSTTRAAGGVERYVDKLSFNVVTNGAVWRIETTAKSCSDGTIEPLTTAEMVRLSGLSLSNLSHKVSVDVRGNQTEIWTELDNSSATRRKFTTVPQSSNIAVEVSVDGVETMKASHSCVTNTVAYDAYLRPIAKTDGRGNTSSLAYDSRGRLQSQTDAAGNATWCAYDAAGRLGAITNALGVATLFEYDVRGNKTRESGGVYPVAYAYDDFNTVTNIVTYRSEASGQGDSTTWVYDEATGLLMQKIYADGRGTSYSYADSGNLASHTWARGVVAAYSYDAWNNLVNAVYSDATAPVSFSYDAMGRQISATDAAGTTITGYNRFGEVESESTTGIYSKTLSHHRDEFGRDLGYTIDNSRKSIIEYEADTARMKRVMMAGAWFTFYYLPGTDLKSRLQYGGSGSAYYTYEPERDLLTQVRNHINGAVVSQYDYVNDALGRRTAITRSGSMMSETRTDHYGYNDRNELICSRRGAETAEDYAYQYDDIGNRISSFGLGTNRTYIANALNQYTNIVEGVDGFVPQFDYDGNQTLIKTATGVWQVTYNGENRPVLLECGATNIVMKFDRMGRRVEYVETVNGATNAHQRFVYDGYLCIQRLNAAANNAIDLVFGWDPSEPIATRPLILQKYGQYNLFYTHDGNKNVSELVFFQQANGIAAHYEYAPFGTVTATSRSTPVTAYDFCAYNPFRFSSEYADDTSELAYYNYRHYNLQDGRFISYDPIFDSRNLYVKADNSCAIDYLGLSSEPGNTTFDIKINGHWDKVFDHYAPGSSLAHQIAVYKKIWVEDTYRIEVQYTKYCNDEHIADVRIDNESEDLVGHLDYGTISAGFVGLGEKYSIKKNELPLRSNNGRHVDLHVVYTVVKESFAAITLGIGPLSIDLGLNWNYTTETVGSGTLILSHDCCN